MKTDIKLDFMTYPKAQNVVSVFDKLGINAILNAKTLEIETNSEIEEYAAIGVCKFYGLLG